MSPGESALSVCRFKHKCSEYPTFSRCSNSINLSLCRKNQRTFLGPKTKTRYSHEILRRSRLQGSDSDSDRLACLTWVRRQLMGAPRMSRQVCCKWDCTLLPLLSTFLLEYLPRIPSAGCIISSHGGPPQVGMFVYPVNIYPAF